MKRRVHFKYPKLFTLIILIFLAYFIFKDPRVSNFVSGLGALSYLGVFIAGLLFSFGFTSPLSAGFFITLNPQNILLTAIIGGIGAMISDLLIFRFIRVSFKKEFSMIRRENISRRISYAMDNLFGVKIKIHLMYVFAGFLIASPLPDEAGVIMLAGLTKINPRLLAILGFILNTIGILLLLFI